MDGPTEADWIVVKRILKYWRGMSNHGLLYGAGNSKGVSEAFSDAKFADDARTRRSTSGVVAVYAGSAITPSSQLQRSVALSTNTEFIPSCEVAEELLWLKVCLENSVEKVVRYPRYMLTTPAQ
jgi:hypothetical protein